MHILINDFDGGERLIAASRSMCATTFWTACARGAARQCRARCCLPVLPRGVLYLFAVAIEQTLLPVIVCCCGRIPPIYPATPVAVIDLLTRRGRIVVHDLGTAQPAATILRVYYLAAISGELSPSAPLFTISDITAQRLTPAGLPGGGPVTPLPNTFYAFERLAAAETPERGPARSVHRLNRQ